jgi:hypothetical protein
VDGTCTTDGTETAGHKSGREIGNNNLFNKITCENGINTIIITNLTIRSASTIAKKKDPKRF